MKFLVDNARSPIVSRDLAAAGHDAVHVRELGIQAEPDEVILERPADENRILISADTDFGTILAQRKTTRPSVVLLRHGVERHPERQGGLLLANLPDLEAVLIEGGLVVIEPSRVRIRSLPLGDIETR